jgi:hypothetical protein
LGVYKLRHDQSPAPIKRITKPSPALPRGFMVTPARLRILIA